MRFNLTPPSFITANKFASRFKSLNAQKQRAVISCAIIVMLSSIYLFAITPIYKAIDNCAARITQKKQDLAWMNAMSGQLSSLDSNQSTVNSQSVSIVSQVANLAAGSAIAAGLTGQTPTGQNGTKVQLENINFDDLILWLGQLQKLNGIRIDEAEISQIDYAGLVNATVALSRSGGQ